MQLQIKSLRRLPFQAAAEVESPFPALKNIVIDADEAQLDSVEETRLAVVKLNLWHARPIEIHSAEAVLSISNALPEVQICGEVANILSHDCIEIQLDETHLIKVWSEVALSTKPGDVLAFQGEIHGSIE